VKFEQDADGVRAWVRTRDGAEYTIRAAYMVAADGGRSQVRGALGIGTSGRGHMRTIRSVLFRAPLEEYLAKGVMQWEIQQPDLEAFLTTYNDGRWVLMFTDDVERDDAQLRAGIVKAIGRSDVPFEIVTTGRWELGAVVADRFSAGRVFLAGDSAHCFPPTRGGYGANTGIHDANNLAWKLAAVLAGTSSPALLETYDAERRPVAWTRHQQIFARPDYKHASNGIAADEPIIDDAAMELGELYRSSVILGAGPDLPAAARPDEWAGQPGTRAPHVWVEHQEKRVSTLDLLSRGWVLFADDDGWAAAAASARSTLKIDVQCVLLGADVRPREVVREALGLGERGASLVRPDGTVAWRASRLPSAPVASLHDALKIAACARA
jgi:putative polyketide hydroxylase